MKYKMRLARSQQQLWRGCLGILAGTLVVSLAFFFLFRGPLHYQVLFFADIRTGEISGERRLLPRLKDREDTVLQLVEEVILGPVDIQHSRVVPRSTQVRGLILRDKVLYLDLSSDIFHDMEDADGFWTIHNAFERTIRFNYRAIREIVFTVDGQEMGVPRYTGLPIGNRSRDASQ
ncbi:MAG: GerMN domain-containing protein [Spirochaeta sp.]|nr:GerMN domain-containing protein [Spirochaeta sp.]